MQALPRSLVLALGLWGTSFFATEPLGAQTAPPPDSKADVVPPRLISEPTVEYPADANGDALVVLAITVNVDGSVRTVRALEGAEPFASAAVRAAETWRFEPATRNGRPVAAIIRFEAAFRAPPPEPPADAEHPEPASAPEAKPAHETTAAAKASVTPAVEVQVVGERKAPAVSSFSRAEVRQLPGAFGDPFRAIEALPGVTPIVSGLPFFYVRGAPPGNVGYFLDGVRVPYLYHVGLGPSVVHPAMVERVDLYPGGYPARYGRFAGGIVAGETTAPRTDLHGEGNIRLFDLGAMVETGFADGRGSILLGGRYSYTAAIVSLLAPDVTLDYRDYQARVSYDLSSRDRVSVFGFGSYDLVGQTKNDIFTVLFGSEFYRLDLRYDHTFGKEDALRYAVSLGYDQTRLTDQRNVRDRMLGSRVELRHRLGKAALLRAGADTVLDGYQADLQPYSDPDDPATRQFNDLFPPRTDLTLGTWADVVLDVAPGVEVTPGVRVDLYDSGGAAAVGFDPRISARFRVSDHVRLIHAHGLAHQPPAFVVPIPGLIPGKLRGGLQTSVQTSSGVEMDLPLAISATASVFHNAFINMSDSIGTNPSRASDRFDQRTQGSALGFELFVRRKLTERLGGFLTYTLSRSTRASDHGNLPSAFDRTHVANAALAYNLGKNWRAGTRLVFYSGSPKLRRTRGLILPESGNPEREPAFYRLDLRLEKRWILGKTSWLAFVVECLNATLNKETVGTEEIGPVTIPSIGLEGGL